MEDLHTLQEFMAYTKSITYLIAVVALFGYVWFWLYLIDRDDDEKEE